MEDLTILVDENIERLDKKLYRVSLCAIEVPDAEVMEELKAQWRDLKADTVRFEQVKKMHLSSLSESQKSIVIEAFSKINITAKMYVSYYFDGNEKDHKVHAAMFAVNNLKEIHKGKQLEIKLEYADEYMGTPLEVYLVKDEELFLAPDSFLGVFIGVLNNTLTERGAIDRMYTLIREKIRLQVFSFADKKAYLISNKRI